MVRATITAEATATASGQRARFRLRRGLLRLAGLRLVATTVLFHFASPGIAAHRNRSSAVPTWARENSATRSPTCLTHR